jgi:hypothetical protein
MYQMNKLKKSRNEVFAMFAGPGMQRRRHHHGIRERHGVVKHGLRMLVAHKLVRGPKLLYALVAAHAHTIAFGAFLRAWFSAPFIGI